MERKLRKGANWLLLAALATPLFFAVGCGGGGGGDDAPPPDPEGTITTSVNYTVNPIPILLYEGLGDDGPYCQVLCPACACSPDVQPEYPYVLISFGMNGSLNFTFHTAAAQTLDHAYTNPYWYGLGSFGGEVAGVGPVGGLGDVTSKPTAGWSTSTMVEPGYGYVLRYKYSINYSTAEVPYHYARVYVENWLLNASNEIIGVKLKYQNEF